MKWRAFISFHNIYCKIVEIQSIILPIIIFDKYAVSICLHFELGSIFWCFASFWDFSIVWRMIVCDNEEEKTEKNRRRYDSINC